MDYYKCSFVIRFRINTFFVFRNKTFEFVCSETRPNSTSPNTDRSNMFGGDSLNYPNAPVGKYFIGIYAFQASTYTVMASLAVF